MKKIKNTIAILMLGGILLPSCIKHEIIPAPEPVVDLKCSFSGVINGSDVQLTQNVNGYNTTPTKEKIILPSPQLSSANYYAQMNSGTATPYVKIGLGSIQWDASSIADPTLSQFNSFFTASTTPAFSDNASNGFKFEYRDGTGKIWSTKQTSPNSQNVTFSNIKQESDASGDYSKFTCVFNGYVYYQDQVTMLWDSMYVANGTYKAWFKR